MNTFVVSAALIIVACGKKKDDMGNVKFSLANGTASLALASTPAGSTGTVTVTDGRTMAAYEATTWALKLIQVYLVEDVGGDGWSNSGQTSYIWINPVCGTKTYDSGAISMANEGVCDTSKITTYFELARSSDQVNADLNSQNIPVLAKTYKYIRMELCDNKLASDLNIKIASTSGGLAKAASLRTGNCIVLSKIDPPLTVAKGDSVKVSLKYDLSKAIVDYNYDTTTGSYSTATSAGTQCAAADSGQGVRCPNDITYTATATK